MLKYLKLAGILAAVAMSMMWVAPAQAQATRTWVSGVGDDANPCSRTAPCKTFAGAISKTAAGGEIDVLDPGGFGAVTINKSITIDGSGGSIAGVLVSGTGGITINDGGAGTVQVTIRNIDFEGIGYSSGNPGIRAIWFVSGAVLNVEHCVIRNFRDPTNGTGISFTPSTSAKLFVNDTILTGNGNGTAGYAVQIAPTGAASNVAALLTNVQMAGNANGVVVDSSAATSGSAQAVVSNSAIQGGNVGIGAVSTGRQAAINVIRTDVQGAAIYGVLANGNAKAQLAISGSSVTGAGTGVAGLGGGQVISYGDNTINQNTSNGTFFITIPKI